MTKKVCQQNWKFLNQNKISFFLFSKKNETFWSDSLEKQLFLQQMWSWRIKDVSCGHPVRKEFCSICSTGICVKRKWASSRKLAPEMITGSEPYVFLSKISIMKWNKFQLILTFFNFQFFVQKFQIIKYPSALRPSIASKCSSKMLHKK